MRLPSTLLVVAALTLLESGSADADANQGTKVSTMASPDLDILAVSHNAGDEKRSLRGLKSVDEEDEERLAGANMFSVTKLEKAIGDPKYAKTLMMRWKRNGYDITKTKAALDATTLAKNPEVNTLYHKYAAWLDKFDDKIAAGGKNLFVKANLNEAVEDSNAAKALFRQWKTQNIESDEVFFKLQELGLKTGDGAYDKLYRNYVSWLNVHYPDGVTNELALESDLFKESMLILAWTDTTYAESLFRAWKTNNYDVKTITEILENTYAGSVGKLAEKYNTWLQTHFPRKAKTARS